MVETVANGIWHCVLAMLPESKGDTSLSHAS